VIVVLSNGRTDPRVIEQICRKALFKPGDVPDLRCEVRAGQYDLGENRFYILKTPFTLAVEHSAKSVTVKVVDPAKDTPMLALSLSETMTRSIMEQLADAIDAKAADAKHDPPECGLALNPYTIPAGGVLVLSGENITCSVVPNMHESGEKGPYVDERITLILSDEATAFLPVMIRMDMAMARALRAGLDQALKNP